MDQKARELHKLFLGRLFNSSLIDLYLFLKQHNLNPADPCDLRESTALHKATLNNSTGVVKMLIQYVQENYPDSAESILLSWVNASNLDGFTALLYAVYRGNMDLVQLYLDLGANPRDRTALGLGVMHVAAQGDRINMISYFLGLGFLIGESDGKGATPLHWAAYFGCEIAAGLLLSLDAPVALVDCTGQSPLHLAVLNGNMRIVRHLLIKGASPYQSDERGRSSLDIAKENSSVQLIGLLKEPGLLSIFGIHPPHRPIRRKRMLLSLYILLLAVGLIGNLGFVFPVIVWYYVLSFIEVLLFLVICNRDPGFIVSPPENTIISLSDTVDPTRICVECIVGIPPRSRHCQTCNRCVLKFDHHCPWVNNCVGGRNLGVFYVFLLVTISFVLGGLYLDGYYAIYPPEDCLPVLRVFCAVFCVIALGFTIPLGILLKVQTENILSNTTTNERFSRTVNESVLERSDSDKMVERNSVLRNCLEACCNLSPRRPLRLDSLASSDNASVRYSWIKSEAEKALKSPLIS